MSQLPNRIRALRRAQGLTQSQLAKLVGVAQPYINEIERGKKRPSVDVLERLCDSLGGSADYLLGVTPGRYSAAGQPVPNINPELLSEIALSGLTLDELKIAIKITRLMREEKQAKAT
ncbi:MAG: helix-turn-helix domain-containing protein [Burkholderiales bacterium]